jgi:hypothetical protein
MYNGFNIILEHQGDPGGLIGVPSLTTMSGEPSYRASTKQTLIYLPRWFRVSAKGTNCSNSVRKLSGNPY